MSDWRQRAACGDMNPHDFDAEQLDADGRYADKPQDVLMRTASVCAGCPVLKACREWAEWEVARSPEMNLIAAGAVYRSGGRQEWREPRVA